MLKQSQKRQRTLKCCIFTEYICSTECYLLHSSNFCAAGGQIQYATEKQCKHEAEVGSDVLGQDANPRMLHIC